MVESKGSFLPQFLFSPDKIPHCPVYTPTNGTRVVDISNFPFVHLPEKEKSLSVQASSLQSNIETSARTVLLSENSVTCFLTFLIALSINVIVDILRFILQEHSLDTILLFDVLRRYHPEYAPSILRQISFVAISPAVAFKMKIKAIMKIGVKVFMIIVPAMIDINNLASDEYVDDLNPS